MGDHDTLRVHGGDSARHLEKSTEAFEAAVAEAVPRVAEMVPPVTPATPATEAAAGPSAGAVAAAVTDSPDVAASLADAQRYAGDAALAAAYAFLQRVVGLIAFFLPVILVVGNLLFWEKRFEGSISSYYYTPLRGVFVGCLFAIAVFFISYNIKPLPRFDWDNWLSWAASAAAVGVALLPTTESGSASDSEKTVGFLHLLCAGVLFGLLAVFALFLFRQSGPTGGMTRRKQQRNRVYLVCGIVIVAAMAMVGVSNLADWNRSWPALLCWEWVAVAAFAVSWLVKGGFAGILADD